MYFVNPKTATTSIGGGPLDERIVAWRRSHTRWIQLWRRLYTNNIGGAFKFVVVRNPWDRVLSAFLYLRRRRKSPIPRGIKFNDYIKTELRYDVNIDRHFAPQSPNFMFKGLVFVDCIIRFEQLQNDWDYVSKRIGVPSELPRLKGTKHTHYTDYYDDESIRIIGDLYKTEIEALGYKFGEN